MKVAIMYSGQPRNIADIWKNQYDKLFRYFDYDLFIYSSEYYNVDYEFWKKLKPKVYVIEDQKSFKWLEEKMTPSCFAPHMLNNYLQQFYGWKKVNELRKFYQEINGIHYDFVIRTRPDVLYFKDISLDIFQPEYLNLFRFPRAMRANHPEYEGKVKSDLFYEENINFEPFPRLFELSDQCFSDVFTIGPEKETDLFCRFFDWLVSGGSDKLKINDPWNSRLPKANADSVNGKQSPESMISNYLVEHMEINCCYAKAKFNDIMSLY